MGYKISTDYCWYKLENEDIIVKMYFMNHIPFTFDEIPSIVTEDPEVITIANRNRKYNPEDLYKTSFYLIDEQAHPCLFPVDLENPEDLPDD